MIVATSLKRRRHIQYIALACLCNWIQGGAVVESYFLRWLFPKRCRLNLSEACGFLYLGSLLRYGAYNTTGCKEICSYFYLTADQAYECGSCTPGPPVSAPVALPPSTFDMFLDLDVPLEDRTFIRRAAERWTNVIRSELVNVPATELAGTTPLDGNCAYPTTIDDLYMCFQYIKIDGLGKVVGRTTILATRDGGDEDGLPISARIRFDIDDVDMLISQGIFQDVVEHEMVHGLGFGILWSSKGLIEPQTGGKCEYVGPKATAEFRNASNGCRTIPNSCGHWDETCMGRELMTDTIGATSIVISKVTLASLEDLGYEVDYDYAADFTEIEINIFCLVGCAKRNLKEVANSNDNLRHPIDLEHASTRQRQRRRKLSDEGYAHAVRHGREIIEQETSQSVKQPKNPTVNVLYMEDNNLYSVAVQRE